MAGGGEIQCKSLLLHLNDRRNHAQVDLVQDIAGYLFPKESLRVSGGPANGNTQVPGLHRLEKPQGNRGSANMGVTLAARSTHIVSKDRKNDLLDLSL